MAQETSTGPLISYKGHLRCWQGEDDTIDIWMSDATFQGYVTAYLETQGVTLPTSDQRVDAVQHLRRVGYWHNVRDSQVHIRPVWGRAGS